MDMFACCSGIVLHIRYQVTLEH
uniref:Uncharacterized protein n=1 Tax=Arundo donax TaxID=35708 RepID=A0A0A9AQK4_ARUDO